MYTKGESGSGDVYYWENFFNVRDKEVITSEMYDSMRGIQESFLQDHL